MGTHPIFESDFDCLTDMGVLFLAHPNGTRFFACRKCDCPIADATVHLITRDHSRRLYTVKSCVNIRTNHSYWRTVNSLTPNLMVRDIACVKCNTNLGWLNEFYRDKEEQSKEGTYSLLQCSIILKDEHSQKIERWFERNLLDSSATDSDLTDSDQDEELDNYGGEQPNAFNIGRYDAIEFLNTNRNLPMFRRLHFRQANARSAGVEQVTAGQLQ